VASRPNPDVRWFVYHLSDPRDGDIRYVGWTVNTKRRIYLHIWHAQNKPKINYRINWIRSLLEAGVEPVITVIDEGVGDSWKDSEKKWIAHYRSAGYRLANLTDGGEGTPGIIVSRETRKLISQNGKGKGRWKKGVEAAAAANRGKPLRPEVVAKIVAKNTGKKRTPEFGRAVAERNRGRKASPETRALLSSIRRGKKRSDVFCHAMTEANLERWAERRSSLKPGETPWWSGMQRTPEQRENIRRGRYPHLYTEDGRRIR
jgi:hypothetical protein